MNSVFFCSTSFKKKPLGNSIISRFTIEAPTYPNLDTYCHYQDRIFFQTRMASNPGSPETDARRARNKKKSGERKGIYLLIVLYEGGGGKEGGGDGGCLSAISEEGQNPKSGLFCGRRGGEKNGHMSGLPIIINIGTKSGFHI